MKFKIKNEATDVASSRSRQKDEKGRDAQTGQEAQDEFCGMIDKLFKEIDAQLEVEPKGVRITPETIIDMINKRDKKKLN